MAFDRMIGAKAWTCVYTIRLWQLEEHTVVEL